MINYVYLSLYRMQEICIKKSCILCSVIMEAPTGAIWDSHFGGRIIKTCVNTSLSLTLYPHQKIRYMVAAVGYTSLFGGVGSQ